MEKERLPSYGGQAIIEGVMMRGSHAVAAAMRNPDGEITVEVEELPAIYKSNIKNIPFLRGLLILWDSMGLGIRYLTMSANIQTGEDEKIEGPALYLTLITSFAVAIALFFLAPAAIGHVLQNALNVSSWWGNIIEGLIRLVILIGYIWGIGQMEDIKRVFSYHGAEHKTINAFEAGAELTPENVKKYSLEHPRCGTAFLLTFVLFSIVLFAALGPMSLGWRLASRVILLPLLAGVSYEYLKWTAGHLDSKFVKTIIKPNLALQGLTTREPSLEILEVSIASFNAMLKREMEIEELNKASIQTAQQPITS